MKSLFALFQHQHLSPAGKRLTIRSLGLAVVILLLVAAVGVTIAHVFAAGTTIYASPTGTGNGTSASSPTTIQNAQSLVRTMNQNMSGDITVVLEDGFYRLTSPLTLTAADSGSNGHNVIWTTNTGAHPVIAGSAQITNWTQLSGSSIWVAQGPSGVQTRQLYVNGNRAQRASGALPVTLTKTSTGYTASSSTMSKWRDPSGAIPTEVELVYAGGLGAWTEPRCPIASLSGTTVTMAQPCWNDSNNHGTNHVGAGSLGAPTQVENAFQLLTKPGQWYLDTHSSKFYYMPRSGEDMATADVEAPVLQSLVTGKGSASGPIHNIIFNGIQFSYATWLGASNSNGFPEIQANYYIKGSSPTAGNATFDWAQIPANVSLTYDQHIQFTNDAFVHLGGAGLGLGDGSQNDLVKGNVVTDTSGNAIELGNDDMPTATGANQTLSNTIQDNHVFNTPIEYLGGIGIDVGYAANTLISHNQVDHTPYSGMSIGWGGWPDKIKHPGLTNFSHNNVISNNLVEFIVTVLADGAAVYTNGQTSNSHSFATGEQITGNVLHDQGNRSHVIYTDNGTDWMTVTGNGVYNTGGANAWGHCHNDYYPGEGGGVDNEQVSGNFWENGPGTSAANPHCHVMGNTVISSPSQIPASIVNNAGLEPPFKGLLHWTQAPNPPVR